jgi:hypothetical protein
VEVNLAVLQANELSLDSERTRSVGPGAHSCSVWLCVLLDYHIAGQEEKNLLGLSLLSLLLCRLLRWSSLARLL